MARLCSGRPKPFAKGLLSDSEEMNKKSCPFMSGLKCNVQVFAVRYQLLLLSWMIANLQDLKNNVVVRPNTKKEILSSNCLRAASEKQIWIFQKIKHIVPSILHFVLAVRYLFNNFRYDKIAGLVPFLVIMACLQQKTIHTASSLENTVT